MSNPKTPFNILFDLNNGKLYSEEQVKEAGLNTFLLINFIRTTPSLLPLAEFINSNWKIPFYNQYLLVYFSFKNLKLTNVRWVKSDKAIKIEDVELIQKYYYVKYRVALDYLQVLNDKDIEHIRTFYKRGGKKDK